MVTGLLSVPVSVFGSPLIWLRASNDTPTDWSADRSEGSPPSGTLRCRDLTFGRPRGIPPRSDIRFGAARLRDGGPILNEALCHQGLAFAPWSARVFHFDGRNGDHGAMAALAAQPAQEDAQEHLGVDAVGLGPPLFPGDRDRGRMDHPRLYAERSSPR